MLRSGRTSPTSLVRGKELTSNDDVRRPTRSPYRVRQPNAPRIRSDAGYVCMMMKSTKDGATTAMVVRRPYHRTLTPSRWTWGVSPLTPRWTVTRSSFVPATLDP